MALLKSVSKQNGPLKSPPGEVRTSESYTAELRSHEVRLDVRISFFPFIPCGRSLLNKGDLLLVWHTASPFH
jgi:hypothetical protein